MQMSDGARPRRPLILRQIFDAAPPVARSAGSCPPASHPGAVTVALEGTTYGCLMSGLPLSDRVEDGGFLAGTCRRCAHHPEAYILRINQVVKARHVRASATRITFTGDSFSAVHDWIAKHDEELDLLGWYHTHLCSPEAEVGLSTMDVDMHLSTFRRPWQVAGLICHDYSDRSIRFYYNAGMTMSECQAWVIDEEGWRRL